MRKTRTDKGLIRLTDRDIKLLRWIGEQYFVRLDTLCLLLGWNAEGPTRKKGTVTEATARRVIVRWKQESLVTSRKYFFSKPDWIWLTRRGIRQTALHYKARSPVVGVLNHYHAVNHVRHQVETHFGRRAAWRGERFLRKTCRNRRGFHVPDGEVLLDDKPVGVEVELTHKSRSRVAQIVEKLDAQYPRVWYFVNSATRPRITAATDHNRRKFRLYDIDQVRKTE